MRSCCALLAAVALMAAPAHAQIMASERGIAAQEVDGTRITVDYGRPQLRGRTPFPNVVKYGEMWTPGANWATTLEVNKAVRIDGTPLKAGRYSMWMVPGDSLWTLHLHPQARRFHTSPPKPAEMVLSIAKAPGAAPSTEVLTFGFPSFTTTSTVLEFRWGTLAFPVQIEVSPSLQPGTLTTATAAPYVGSYTMTMYGEHGDSTTEKMEVVLKNGRLHGVPTTPDMEFAFLPSPTKRGVSFAGFIEKGEIVAVEANSPITWRMVKGRAVQFTVAGASGDGLWFKGVRK